MVLVLTSAYCHSREIVQIFIHFFTDLLHFNDIYTSQKESKENFTSLCAPHIYRRPVMHLQ